MMDAAALRARTDAFADLSIKFVEGLPEVPRITRLALQYQDASTSVAANYRAARHAKSRADFTYKIGVVSEEADESVFWLRRLLNGKVESRTVPVRQLLDEAEQLARIFGASHGTARRRRRRRPDDVPDDRLNQ